VFFDSRICYWLTEKGVSTIRSNEYLALGRVTVRNTQ
jgi:hypothetical protein